MSIRECELSDLAIHCTTCWFFSSPCGQTSTRLLGWTRASWAHGCWLQRRLAWINRLVQPETHDAVLSSHCQLWIRSRVTGLVRMTRNMNVHFIYNEDENPDQHGCRSGCSRIFFRFFSSSNKYGFPTPIWTLKISPLNLCLSDSFPDIRRSTKVQRNAIYRHWRVTSLTFHWADEWAFSCVQTLVRFELTTLTESFVTTRVVARIRTLAWKNNAYIVWLIRYYIINRYYKVL